MISSSIMQLVIDFSGTVCLEDGTRFKAVAAPVTELITTSIKPKLLAHTTTCSAVGKARFTRYVNSLS